MQNKKAITLVELLIVITLVVILGVVAFYSFSSYLTGVRDSTRIVELENISTSLGSYNLRAGRYPEPDNAVEISYSGGLVWTQGEFGEDIAKKIGYFKESRDPLTESRYTYSIKNSKKEYSLAGVLEESPGLVSDSGFVSKSYADKLGIKTGYAIVTGNYNGEVVYVQSTGANYILALPTIVSSDLSSNNLVDILNNNNLVYDDFENIPASYTGTIYNMGVNINLAPNNLIVYSGSVKELSKSYNQISLLQNLDIAYSGSLLGKKISVNRVYDLDLHSSDPSSNVRNLACDVVNFKVKYFIPCGDIDFLTFFVINVLHIDISILEGVDLQFVYQNLNGDFIFGTEKKGLYFYDGINWINFNADNSGLVDNKVKSMTQDNVGNYWIGTEEGLSKLTFSEPLVYSGATWVTFNEGVLPVEEIKYVYTASGGTVWIGTEGGVAAYNGNAWQIIGITDEEITSIYTDSLGNAWFGTKDKGVYKYNIATEQFDNYLSGVGGNGKIEYISGDNTGRLWVGSEVGVMYTTDSGSNWTTFDTGNSGLIHDYITYIFDDTLGNIRIGTKQGVSEYDSLENWTNYSTATTPNVLLGNDIFLIYRDDSGNIVIFSDQGVDTIDPSGTVITPPQ